MSRLPAEAFSGDLPAWRAKDNSKYAIHRCLVCSAEIKAISGSGVKRITLATYGQCHSVKNSPVLGCIELQQELGLPVEYLVHRSAAKPCFGFVEKQLADMRGAKENAQTRAQKATHAQVPEKRSTQRSHGHELAALAQGTGSATGLVGPDEQGEHWRFCCCLARMHSALPGALTCMLPGAGAHNEQRPGKRQRLDSTQPLGEMRGGPAFPAPHVGCACWAWCMHASVQSGSSRRTMLDMAPLRGAYRPGPGGGGRTGARSPARS